MPDIDSVNISLPSLLDEVFAKFSPRASKENIGELLVELDALLSSRVVQAALQLLDYQNIVIYHNSSKTQQIAEINEGYRHGTLKLVRLFPRINYCTCDNFQQQVVGNQTNPSTAPYTCEHVLALRLAVLLESDKLRYEELPAHKLKTLFSRFLPDNVIDD
ncbi:uncharacterized protein LOC101887367 [Musca domestica]|uniref:Uncharacterized protein LOC101887367 n=1 Tax=Musca domestica TaxID=7370 RepID=A0ABM3VEG5_MUSDO|nr:uncharacterized protein LOC101887367 [Musca domestica]